MARNTKGRLFTRGKKKNYYLQYYLNGKQIVQSLKDDNGNPVTSKLKAEKLANSIIAPYLAKDEALRRQLAADALKNAKEKAEGLMQRSKQLKLENVWQTYLDVSIDDRPDSGLGTLNNYKRHWTHFVEWLNGTHPEIKYFGDEITEAVAKEYAAYLRKLKIADSTFNYKLTSVKLITRVLIKQLGLSINVWNSIKRVNNPKQDTKDAFTFEQGFALLESFNNPYELMHKEQVKVIFAIGIFSGMRLADCVLLKWDNIISYENGLTIKCIPQKTQRLNKEIIAPIVKPFQDILSSAHDWKNDSGFICPDVAARFQYNPSGVRKDLIKVFKHAGYTVSKKGSSHHRKVSAVGFHSLRHALFSHLASKGITIEKLASWSGDSQKTLLKYYLHADSNKLI